MADDYEKNLRDLQAASQPAWDPFPWLSKSTYKAIGSFSFYLGLCLRWLPKMRQTYLTPYAMHKLKNWTAYYLVRCGPLHEHDFLVPWSVTHKMDAGVITEIYTNEVMGNALKLILAWRSKCLISFLVVKLCLKGF